MENSEICEWLRLSFLQIVCEQDEYEIKSHAQLFCRHQGSYPYTDRW